MASPITKYAGTSCFGALYDLCGDTTFKISAYFTDTVLDPKTRDSFRADETAFNRAFNTDKPYWVWAEEPGHERHLQRVGLAMEGVANVFNRVGGARFDWKSVKAGGVVVDVGGGFGSPTMIVARQNPHLKFVIQDRGPVVEQAKGVRLLNLLRRTLYLIYCEQLWNNQFPEAISLGSVVLQRMVRYSDSVLLSDAAS